MAYRITIPIPLRQSQVGLVLHAKLFNLSEVQVGSDITETFIEVGEGGYAWDTSEIPTSFRGIAKFYDSDDNYVGYLVISPEAVERIYHLDADISSIEGGGGGPTSDPWETPLPGDYGVGEAGYILGNLAGATQIGFQVPTVGENGDVENLIKGQDYTGARKIPFTDPGDWPNLGNATIYMEIVGVGNIDMEVTDLDPTQIVSLEMDGDYSAALPAFRYKFKIFAKLTNQDDHVLGRGRLIFNG
jgi:hypothetical protein